jgi:hypothetical protein
MGSAILALVCPLVGTHLILRRRVFLGLTLPQVAACGVAFTFWIYHEAGATHGAGGERLLAVAGSLTFTLAGMAVLAYLDAHASGSSEGRLAAAYALASALTILFIVFNPAGELEILNLLKGEVIARRSDRVISGRAQSPRRRLRRCVFRHDSVSQRISLELLRPRFGVSVDRWKCAVGFLALRSVRPQYRSRGDHGGPAAGVWLHGIAAASCARARARHGLLFLIIIAIWRRHRDFRLLCFGPVGSPARSHRCHSGLRSDFLDLCCAGWTAQMRPSLML